MTPPIGPNTKTVYLDRADRLGERRDWSVELSLHEERRLKHPISSLDTDFQRAQIGRAESGSSPGGR